MVSLKPTRTLLLISGPWLWPAVKCKWKYPLMGKKSTRKKKKKNKPLTDKTWQGRKNEDYFISQGSHLFLKHTYAYRVHRRAGKKNFHLSLKQKSSGITAVDVLRDHFSFLISHLQWEPAPRTYRNSLCLTPAQRRGGRWGRVPRSPARAPFHAGTSRRDAAQRLPATSTASLFASARLEVAQRFRNAAKKSLEWKFWLIMNCYCSWTTICVNIHFNMTDSTSLLLRKLAS